MNQISNAYPTEAKSREKERRRAQKASGKSHVVIQRDLQFEEHYNDCGEDLSSLTGAEMFSLAWATSLHEDAKPLIADEARSDETF